MKVIVGLGNPGPEYERTRHNVGWWVLDHLAGVWRLGGWKKDGQALTVAGTVGGTRVRLVKPLTYMNLSGAVLKPYLRRPAWTAATDLFVVTDDVALPVGTFRIRARGSAGGHNGLKSIEAALGRRTTRGYAWESAPRTSGGCAEIWPISCSSSSGGGIRCWWRICCRKSGKRLSAGWRKGLSRR